MRSLKTTGLIIGLAALTGLGACSYNSTPATRASTTEQTTTRSTAPMAMPDASTTTTTRTQTIP
jgi:uncharacterized lipoprotein